MGTVEWAVQAGRQLVHEPEVTTCFRIPQRVQIPASPASLELGVGGTVRGRWAKRRCTQWGDRAGPHDGPSRYSQWTTRDFFYF